MISRLKDKAFRRGLFTIIKFILAAVLTLMTYSTTRQVTYLSVGLVELAFIFVIYNFIVEKNKFCRFISGLLFFIYVAQMVVLYFGNSYVTLTMLKNIKFLQDLGGEIVAYSLGTILALVIIFIPGRNIFKADKRTIITLFVAFIFIEMAINANYKRFSPVQSFATIFADEIRYQHVKRAAANPEVALATFYQKESADVAEKPGVLPEQPNIILIFTE